MTQEVFPGEINFPQTLWSRSLVMEAIGHYRTSVCPKSQGSASLGAGTGYGAGPIQGLRVQRRMRRHHWPQVAYNRLQGGRTAVQNNNTAGFLN